MMSLASIFQSIIIFIGIVGLVSLILSAFIWLWFRKKEYQIKKNTPNEVIREVENVRRKQEQQLETARAKYRGTETDNRSSIIEKRDSGENQLDEGRSDIQDNSNRNSNEDSRGVGQDKQDTTIDSEEVDIEEEYSDEDFELTEDEEKEVNKDE